jgi:hypothetical protein
MQRKELEIKDNISCFVVLVLELPTGFSLFFT